MLEFDPVDNVVILIDPHLTSLTGRSLLEPAGEVGTAFEYLLLGFSTTFKLSTPDFVLEAGTDLEGVFIRRNEQIARVSIPQVPLGLVSAFILFGWTPTSLRVAFITQDGDTLKEVETPVTYPPNRLLRWARKKALLPSGPQYIDRASVVLTVLEQLQALQAKMSNVDLENLFWDVTREGNRIVEKVPKREGDFHAFLETLLYDFDLTKNLEVTPERQLGNGALDFLITGTLSSGEVAHICVEVKKLHAEDLVHGLEVQLREYMRRKETDYGIYIVLDYGPEWPQTDYFTVRGAGKLDPSTSIWNQLSMACLDMAPTVRIQPFVFKLFSGPSPSKM